MIISHKYKFIFIKTGKTAGTSIEVFLSQFCGENDIVPPIYPYVAPHRARNYKGFWIPIPDLINSRGRGYRWILKHALNGEKYFEHLSALNVKTRISDSIWNNYYKFCVERNPWDRAISHYYMMKDRTDEKMTFNQYIKRGVFQYNFQLYTSKSGKVIVDKIIYYESLMYELTEIFQMLGIPFNGSLGARAKSNHRTDYRDYKQIYTHEQRMIIQKAFAKEINLHGYTY